MVKTLTIKEVRCVRSTLPVIIRNQRCMISYISQLIRLFRKRLNEAIINKFGSKSKAYKEYIKRISEAQRQLKGCLQYYQRGLSNLKIENSYDHELAPKVVMIDSNAYYVGHNDLYTDFDIGLPFILKYLHNIKY